MKKALYFLFISILSVNMAMAATLTPKYVPVTNTGGSTPTVQNGSILDNGTSAGPGNVGINSTSPTVQLDVGGTVRATAFIQNNGSSNSQIYPITASEFPRIRIASPLSGIALNLTYETTNGTTQLSNTDRTLFTLNSTYTDLSFLFGNGQIGSSGLIPNGNSFAFKAFLEYYGNMYPISFPSNTGAAMPTVAQTGVSTSVTTGVNSTTQTLGSTTGILPGCILYFATAGVSATVASVTNSTTVVLWTSVNSTTNETVTIIGYQGTSTLIGDGQVLFTTPLGLQLYPATNYRIRTYRKCNAGQVMPETYPYSVVTTSSQTSDAVFGSTTTDGADYSAYYTNVPGNLNSSGEGWGPMCIIGRQINPVPVVMVIGDSIAYGVGSTAWSGYLGQACTAAGVAFWDGGIGGITATNMTRFQGITQRLSRYVDYVLAQIGTNDVNSSGNALSYFTGTIELAILNMAQDYASGGATIWFSTLPPRTASTDNWVTTVNQTPTTNEGVRVAMNNWFRDTSLNGAGQYISSQLLGIANLGGFNDTSSAIERTSSAGAVPLTSTTYVFTVASSSVPYLSTYTDSNGQTYTTGPATSSGTTLFTTAPTATPPPASGTLTYVSGSTPGNLTYTAFTQSSPNQQAYGTGGYWIVNGSSQYYTPDGIHPASPATALMAPLVSVTQLKLLPTQQYNTNSIS